GDSRCDRLALIGFRAVDHAHACAGGAEPQRDGRANAARCSCHERTLTFERQHLRCRHRSLPSKRESRNASQCYADSTRARDGSRTAVTVKYAHGEVDEWFKSHAWKACLG